MENASCVATHSECEGETGARFRELFINHNSNLFQMKFAVNSCELGMFSCYKRLLSGNCWNSVFCWIFWCLEWGWTIQNRENVSRSGDEETLMDIKLFERDGICWKHVERVRKLAVRSFMVMKRFIRNDSYRKSPLKF
jgi:hypothetical protein